ncbi:hypothetical protein [Rariglobus hedericola]|uniref:Uncharacterized protein n=1 Tax=Rariglobus hedericola TaxID=2597822 RepID=A0A556QNJ5_9BACT|nr:hypothetical protein [Rariglobus hedericola]TSJ78172.1 hypothetical protein FPL22_02365 [Rariglobus hedericola]
MNTTIPTTTMRRTQSPFATTRYTSKDWDEVRVAFGSSILVDTSLTSLAQNLEGAAWPLAGLDETPATYIDLSFDDMRERLALQGQPPRIADQLIEILKETLAFDEPFGDMVTQSESATVDENPLVKNLSKLKIPLDFPVTLTALSAETLLFCRLENITTIGGFALTAQRMAGTVVVGGDFRSLLNALSNIDERTLARYLPFRPGSKGLHYIEGLAQCVESQPVAIQAALARSLKQEISAAAEELARGISDEQLAKAKHDLQVQAAALRGFCPEDYADLQAQIASGTSPRRLTTVLGEPSLEAVVTEFITPVAAKPKATGFFARLTRLWRK